MLDGSGWWICVQNFKSISSKMAELWHKTCWKQPNLPIFAIFIFWPILKFQKVFLGHFSCSLRKVDLTTCISVPYHDFFWGVDLFYRITWDDLDLYYIQAECLNLLQMVTENLHTKFQPIRTTKLSVIAIYTQIASGHILLASALPCFGCDFFLKLKSLRHSFLMFNDDVMTHTWS